MSWQKAAYAAGLVGCDYPGLGGGGRTDCQRVANEEMQAARAVLSQRDWPGYGGADSVHHAREDVKRELLPRLFSGEDIWCQGFSEPGAGSDLASVQTFAEPRNGASTGTRCGPRWRTLPSG